MQLEEFALVVIDPVVAFTAPGGTLWKRHGSAEMAYIADTVPRLAGAAREFGDGHRTVWVTSLYERGQFGHDVENLCTFDNETDRAWHPQLCPPPRAATAVKRQPDATSSAEFMSEIDRLISAQRVTTLLVTGFLLTTCVEATAIALANAPSNDRARVVVPLNLTASRVATHTGTDTHPSAVTRTVEHLRCSGVHVVPALV